MMFLEPVNGVDYGEWKRVPDIDTVSKDVLFKKCRATERFIKVLEIGTLQCEKNV